MKQVASVNYDGCIACETCIGICPVEALYMKNGHAKVDYRQCIHCGACMDICPVSTIESKEVEGYD